MRSARPAARAFPAPDRSGVSTRNAAPQAPGRQGGLRPATCSPRFDDERFNQAASVLHETVAHAANSVEVSGRAAQLFPEPSHVGVNRARVESVSRSEEHTSELQSLAYLVCR